MDNRVNFNTQQDLVLENELVRLEPLNEIHYQYLHKYLNEEPYIWQYSYLSMRTNDEFKSYINNALQERINGNEYAFAVFDKLKNEYAGSTRFYDINLKYATTQLGYTWYGKKFQGTYVNKNCKLLLLQFAFDVAKFHRVEFRADNDNKKSIAAMQKIGCVVEGVLRESMPKPDGTRRNSIILSLLKQEWVNGVGDRLIADAKLKV